MSESSSVITESAVSNATGFTNQSMITGSTQPLPLRSRDANSHNDPHQNNLQQLPSHKFCYSVWHDLREVEVTGDQLRAPRVRKAPVGKDQLKSKITNDDGEFVHHDRTGRNRKIYQENVENWENAKFISLSYQELSTKYQNGQMGKILSRFEQAEHVNLVDNGIVSLNQFKFPRCVHLNLSDNYIGSFKGLPSVPSISTLNLDDNNIPDLKGLHGFKKSGLESISLKRNPVTFTANYRPRVFTILPNLKILDGLPKLASDSEMVYDDSSSCNIL